MSEFEVVRQGRKGRVRALDVCKTISKDMYILAVFGKNIDLFGNLKLITRLADFHSPPATLPSELRLLLAQSTLS
jgi:hypothetical protein